ncbi:MAG: SIMPL domain-containing protein [Chloroflexota bacterium]|nr:SIMPL domain-containing protein [Chloroflexota bacterium]
MKRGRLAIIGVLGAAAFLTFGAATCGAFGSTTTTVQTTPNQPSGISVSGEGKVTGKPDLARLQLGVSVLRDTVAAARDQAATSLTAITKALRADGVADKDIQTLQLNISPEYDYTNGRQLLKGFRVTNVLSVKVRDINNTSKVVDDAVNAGGNDTQIQSIAFTIDKPADLQRQAREAAVADAKAKAQTLASASGVSLGSVTAISESGGVKPVQYSGADLAARAGAAPATPIQPGELDVSVNVNVTWAIR